MTGTGTTDYRTVLEEHQGLRTLLGEMEEMLAEPPESGDRAGWLARLGDYLETLREQLVPHFQTEEDGGFFREIAEAWPNAASRCDALIREHGQLVATLDDLIAATIARPTADVPFQSLLVRSCGLVKEILHHEQRENELLYQAIEGGPQALD